MAAQWTKVISIAELPADDVSVVTLEKRELALFRIGSAVYATDNLCTHGNARLCDGFLDGHEIECPLHQGKFDVRTGRAMCEPLTEDIATYPVELRGDDVYVEV
jgi:naphthalene 1,2-dioxygenase system ferredoxin subunit